MSANIQGDARAWWIYYFTISLQGNMWIMKIGSERTLSICFFVNCLIFISIARCSIVLKSRYGWRRNQTDHTQITNVILKQFLICFCPLFAKLNSMNPSSRQIFGVLFEKRQNRCLQPCDAFMFEERERKILPHLRHWWSLSTKFASSTKLCINTDLAWIVSLATIVPCFKFNQPSLH